MRQSPAGSVFLPFGFVSAHLQVYFNLCFRQRPMIGTARQRAKIQLPHRYIISVNALIDPCWATKQACRAALCVAGSVLKIIRQGFWVVASMLTIDTN